MKEIIVASSNEGKIKEIRSMLSDIGIEVKSLKDIGQDIEIEETGTTFKENALIKAQTVCDIIHKPVLADDSGLEVKALDGAPGIYSARFLGHDTSYDIKNQYIIDAVKDKDRTARFVCAMALCIPNEEPIIIEEYFNGEINDCIEGENGFGYDPIFYVPELKMTSAQISPEKKNQISHRGKALRKLYDILKERLS
ncbi:MAG: XTP/dITP diphosphatase [Erysipelotrichaceae bacterium]|nr:XTP/dITP diphosphatase [Erysipelotrichaceae bacterium]